MALITIRRLREIITVEPVLFIYMLAVWLQFPTVQALIFQKVCVHNFNDSICDNMHNETYSKEEKFVQKETSHWILYTNICLTLPSIIMSAFIGSWSDKIGRKVPIILPSIGAILAIINYIIQTIYMKLPLALVLISPFLSGIAGGFVTCILTVFSYMATITDESTRTVRVGILEAMSFLGGTAGLFISGVLLDTVGYFYVFIVMGSCHIILIVYTLVWVREIQPDQVIERKSNMCYHLFNLDHFVESVTCVFKPRELNRRLNLWLTLVALWFSFLAFSAHSDLIFLYLKHPPLNFDIKMYGYYMGFFQVMTGIGLLVIMPCCKRLLNFKDYVVIIMGFVSRCLALILLGVSSTLAMIFVVPVLGVVQGFAAAGCRALLSKFVEKEEQGKLFAFVASGESLITLLASVIFNNLYPATLSFYPGLSFLLAAGLLIIPIILILYVHRNQRLEDMYNQFLSEADGIVRTRSSFSYSDVSTTRNHLDDRMRTITTSDDASSLETHFIAL